MRMFRLLLKRIISLLARWAIRKHDIELVIVTGFHGTELVKEGIYHSLSQKFNVRRNTNQILWDMAIPLSILGYADRRRNPVEWFALFLRATLYLLFGPKNPHTIVLNANCTFKETAEFWSSFLKPDYLIILNGKEKSRIVDALLDRLDPEKGTLIYNADQIGLSSVESRNFKNMFSYSGSNDADLVYSVKERILIYKSSKTKLPTILPPVLYSHIAAIFSLGIKKGISLEESAYEALKFDLSSILLQRITKNIEGRRIN